MIPVYRTGLITKLRQGNVFTPLCHSVGGGGRESLSHDMTRGSFRGGSVYGVSIQGGVVSVQGRGVSVQGEGSLSREGVSVQGGGLSWEGGSLGGGAPFFWGGGAKPTQ